MASCFGQQESSKTSSPAILVINKIDCIPSTSTDSEWGGEYSGYFSKHVFTCAVSGQGIEELEMAVSEIVGLNKIPEEGRRWTVNQVLLLIFLFELSV